MKINRVISGSITKEEAKLFITKCCVRILVHAVMVFDKSFCYELYGMPNNLLQTVNNFMAILLLYSEGS